MRHWLRVFLRIPDIELEQQRTHARLNALANVCSELSSQLSKHQEELKVRTSVMRDELMESEARLMNLIEEMQSQVSKTTDNKDTLPEENSSGYVRWSARKRSAQNKATDPTAWKRKTNGALSSPGRPE